jgi:hypothetical protein
MVLHSFRKHLYKGSIIGGLMVLSLTSRELSKKTLSHKGFIIILTNHLFITNWTYNLKHFIKNEELINYWKKTMRIQFSSLILMIIGRSYRLIEKYYIK